MSTFQQQYKAKKFGFGNAKESRLTRVEKHEELRRKQRAKAFNENRNISTSSTNKSENRGVQPAPVAQESSTRLMKWKAEREKHRLEQMKKRPPFVVGKVHHKIYSPISNSQSVALNTTYQKVRKQTVSKPPVPKPSASPPKRITRATEKRLINKILAKQTTNNVVNNSKSTNKQQKSEEKQGQSFASTNYKFKAPAGLSRISLIGKAPTQSVPLIRRSKLMSPSIKTSQISKSNTTELIKKIFNNIKNDTPAVDKEKDTDDLHDSSIEPVSLKLSFNETFTSSNENDNDDANKVETRDNVHTNSVPETLPSKNASTPKDSPNEPVFFSPYVVSSRGKSNARKEQQLKRGFSLNRSQNDDIPTKDTIMKTLNISVEEEERTAQYFRFLLNREIDRLNELCEKWIDIKEDTTTTEDGQYEINQAIGQTNLLINKKFERFRRLVADCETGKGEMLVTCKDLQGFWDMMYMEVKDCDMRFERLEKLRSQNWIEEQLSVPKAKPVIKKKNVTKKKAAPTKLSSLRAFLAEKKKNIAQQTTHNGSIRISETINNHYPNNMHENNKIDPNTQSKTRRSSAFVEFKRSTPANQQKTRLSLLPKSRLSVTSKSLKSPLTIIKVSQMCKTPDVQLDNTISYINSNQTPGKGILKQAKNANEIRSSVKSSKVNFNDRVVLKEVPVDEESKLKSDLAAALDRIDSFDFETPDEVVINAERKLSFDDKSFDESEEDAKENFELNSIDRRLTKVSSKELQTATLSKHSELNRTYTPTPEKKSKNQNSVNESDKDLILNVTLIRLENIAESTDFDTPKQHSPKRVSVNKEETSGRDGSIRILRNRIITSVDTPRPTRSSRKMSVDVQDSEQNENKTPSMKTRRKNSVKVTIEDKEKKDIEDSLDKMSSNENDNKRKSRRSVKFSEMECSGCVPSKPALPMTPHVRRSRTKSVEKRGSVISEDHTSWKTPEKLPDRVRRSRSKKTDLST